MKILLITGDTLAPWAITFRANELKKRWVDDEVEIVTSFKGNPCDYDVIHILFSAGIGDYNSLVGGWSHIYTSVVSANTLDYSWDSAETLRSIFQNSKKVVCLNPRLQQSVIDLMGLEHASKAVYIPNGVDGDLFSTNLCNGEPKKFVVGFVGSNFSQEYKGLHLIKEACEKLDVELLINNCNYPDSVTPRENMPGFYSCIDCLCIASLGEGTNNPTLEALSMNKPVISTRTGIAEELEGVILVERNVISIIQGIRKVYTRKGIIENYTWDRIAKKYHDLYTSNQP